MKLSLTLWLWFYTLFKDATAGTDPCYSCGPTQGPLDCSSFDKASEADQKDPPFVDHCGSAGAGIILRCSHQKRVENGEVVIFRGCANEYANNTDCRPFDEGEHKGLKSCFCHGPYCNKDLLSDEEDDDGENKNGSFLLGPSISLTLTALTTSLILLRAKDL